MLISTQYGVLRILTNYELGKLTNIVRFIKAQILKRLELIVRMLNSITHLEPSGKEG